MLWQKVFVEIKILVMRLGNFKVVFLSLAFLLFAGVLNAGDFVIFYDDFGELESDNEFHRSQSEYVHDVSRGGAFNYRADCVPIKGQNFSDYAVVSTPFWSGCTFHDEYDISTCDCTEGFWFKHCFDHTHNGINPATGKFGGMLFINPQSDNIPDDFSVLVYSREFRNTCENSFVSFSVWFRSATELWPGMSLDPIRSKLRVKHTDTGEYISEADIEIVIDAMTDEWHFGESRFFTGVGNLTVELWNLARGGQNGNDLLIDDITVKVDEPNTALVASGDNVIIDGNDVTGPCGTSYYLNVDKDEVEKSWGNPYYLWLYKTPSMNDFEPHPTFVSSSVQQPQLDVNTAYKVIVGASEQACLDYYRGSATGGCIMAVETNVVTSHCTEIHIYQNDRTDCNALSFTSSEDAYLFSSSDGSSWRNVLDVTGAPMYGSSFSVEITGDSDKFFRVGVAMSNPDIWRYSETIQVEYYQLEQLVQEAGKASSVTNTTLYVEKGSDIELLAAAASYVGGASYSFTDVTNPDAPVAVGTLSQAQVEAGESIMVSKIEENRVFSMSAGTLSATSGLALCTANNVTVTVQDTVEIPEPDPDHGVVPIRHTGCNNVVVTSESSTDNVYWFSGVKSAASSEIEWTMIGSEPIGKVFEVEMTANAPRYYRAGVKKATAQGEDWNYSRTVELEYYQLEQLVQEAGKASSVTNTTLYVEKGSDIELLAAATSYVGGASYSFTDVTNPDYPVAVGTLSQAQVEAGESIMVSGIEENRVFSMSAGTLSATSGLALCTANNVTVTVQDTVEIPEPDPDHGVVPIRHTGCNNVEVTSESSTDNVYWFSGVKSAAGSEIEWTMIGSEPMGKVFEVEMTANAPRYYHAGVKKATAQGEDWNYSRTVEIEYYQLEQLVQEAGKASSVTNTTLYVEKGSDIELLAAATSYVGGASYSFTDITSPNTPVQVGVLTQAQVEAGESISVSKIDENRVFSMSAGTLSATSGLALCTANNVTVTVQDTVEIPEPDPDHGVVPIRHTGCNNVVVTSESSTDNVYWFSGVKSAAGSEIEWTMIGSEPMGKVFEVEMTSASPIYYRAGVKKATAQGEDWNYSRTVELEYYSVSAVIYPAGMPEQASDKVTIPYGSDIVVALGDNTYAGTDAEYKFYDKDDNLVGTVKAGDTDKGMTLKNLIEDNEYHVSTELCVSNNVSVTVLGSVTIDIKRNCNQVTADAIMEGSGQIAWYFRTTGDWQLIESASQEITLDIKENTQLKAVMGTIESEVVDVEYYDLSLSVINDGTGESSENLNIVIGAKVRLSAQATGMPGEGVYDFYDENNVLVAQMSADMPEYECAPSVDKQYYVTFSGCSSNRVNVKVDWPTVFTPYNADGFNDDFVKDVEPAIAVKVFDRSGNMVADSDNGWDGYVASGNLAMPGVYYYVAVLSDGTVRRGPIEVYKK